MFFAFQQILKTPTISVIIPCRNGTIELAQCLGALAAAPFPGAEVIVINDGSTEDLRPIVSAAGFPIRLIDMGERQGSSAARNRGARLVAAEVLVFLDADTCVHGDTLSRIASAFENDPDLGALIGAYDDQPTQLNFYSQYRNLLHCYVHRTSSRRACTFWTGCGAIRRDIFLAYGGFNESRPNIDDVEFGSRLARDGVRIELQPEVQVRHQKRWTFGLTLKTDILLRGIPWARLILRERRMPNALNVTHRNRLSVVLVAVAVAAALIGFRDPNASALALTIICAVAWINRSFYSFLRQRRGTRFVPLAFLAHLLHFLVCAISFLAGVTLFVFLESTRPESVSNLLQADAE